MILCNVVLRFYWFRKNQMWQKFMDQPPNKLLPPSHGITVAEINKQVKIIKTSTQSYSLDNESWYASIQKSMKKNFFSKIIFGKAWTPGENSDKSDDQCVTDVQNAWLHNETSRTKIHIFT